MPTISDIARLAGVTATTVSNVINGNHKRVSPQTVARIQAIIQREGYVPSMAARSLKTNASKIIGVFNLIVPEESGGSFQDPFHSALLTGIELELRRSDYFMMVRTVYTAEELLEFLSNWNIDALILTGILNQDFYEQLKTQPAPFLLVDSEVHDESRMQVHLKDREGGLMATRHLISLGHERILFCGPAPMEEGVIKERLMGYRQALQEAGLPFVQERLLLSPMGIREAADLGRALALRDDFTAIFATADVLAAGIMAGLQNAGRRIPEDISVIGFDDLPVAQLTVPQLTTIRQDVVQRGRAAVRMLLSSLAGKKPDNITFPVELVQRGSTGPARR
ncbi:MAG: LacI family transcriptional regulator [Clostridiales bacterium]|nr:LacI family transcriptional regulator [Clostridiales bacterium]